jgi:hypothetical protein
MFPFLPPQPGQEQARAERLYGNADGHPIIRDENGFVWIASPNTTYTLDMKDKPLGYHWSNVNPANYHDEMTEDLFKKWFGGDLPPVPPSYPKCKLSDVEIESTLDAIQSGVAYITGKIINKCSQAVFSDLEETFLDGRGKVLYTRISRYDTSTTNSNLERNHFHPGNTDIKFNLPVLVQAKSVKIKAVSLGQ